MEGVAFSLRNAYEQLDLSEIDVFRVIRGIIKSQSWLQLVADVFDRRLEVLRLDEEPVFGTLMCAIKGTTAYSNEALFEKYTGIKTTVSPIPTNVAQYELVYTRFLYMGQGQADRYKEN